MSTNAYELYWAGRLKIELSDLDQFGSIENDDALKFLNFAFELFYNCRQGIMLCNDADMKKEMTDELEDAATEGAGKGVDDLREAIAHAVADKAKGSFDNLYQWYSNKTETYSCVRYDPNRFLNPYDRRIATIWQGGDVKSAKAAVKFVSAMDEKFRGIGGATKPYSHAVDMLRKVVDNNNSADADWKKLGKALTAAGDAAGEVKKWMWLAPNRLKGFDKYIGSASSFLGVANKLHELGSNYVHYGNNAEMAVLETVLGYLPILGGFYAKALHMIPGLEQWYRRVIEHRVNRIDAIINGRRKHGRGKQLGVRTYRLAARTGAVRGGSRIPVTKKARRDASV